MQVRADSEFASVDELLTHVRDNPEGALKGSGTGQGGIWHLALAGMLKTAGIEPAMVPWVPSEGAAPGLQDLVAGGVDVVTCSVPEAQSLIDAGRVKSLAVMGAERNPSFPDVPTLQEVGIDWRMGAWRGVAGPAGLPDEVVDTIVPLLEKIHASDEFREFMSGARLRHGLRGARGLRAVHDEQQRGSGRGDEGAGPGPVARRRMTGG